jgi:hypothetical protein
MNWFNCIATIRYSNYGKDKETPLQIIKNILVDNNLKVDDSFDKVQTNVKINYITNGNQNILTAIDYLLSKMYYFYDSKDDSFKCIYYNDLLHEYGIFDMKDQTSIIGSSTILVSLFGS